ncbi:MAG: hypothetical protein NZ455_01040 [Bacteroidia bacterium]|nr:hypothetical protein [Bacteroidia bacterium]
MRNAPTRAKARDTPKKVKLFFRLSIFRRVLACISHALMRAKHDQEKIIKKLSILPFNWR